MRKLVYSYLVSLDGFIEGPNRELDWPVIDEEFHLFVNQQMRRFDTHLYGRRMYEVLAYWQKPDPTLPYYELEYARIWQETPKVVFSRTLDQVGENARLVKENAVEEVRRLKAQPGNDLALAGAGHPVGDVAAADPRCCISPRQQPLLSRRQRARRVRKSLATGAATVPPLLPAKR